MPATNENRIKTSTLLTFFNLIKAFLGTGLLVIPYGARCGGMWLSFFGIILLGLGSNLTLKMIIRSKRQILRTHPTLKSSRITFDALGYYAFGNKGKMIAIFAQVFTNIGIVMGYAIFIGKTFLMCAEICGMSPSTMDPELYKGGLRVSLFLVASFPILGGLALLRSMRKLGPVSLVGTVAIIMACIAVFYASAMQISHHGIIQVPSARWETFPTFFGLLVFSYAIHGIVLSIEEGMEHPEQMEFVTNLASIIVVVIYLAFSVLCYFAYGDKVNPSILTNLPQDTRFDQILKVSTGLLLSISILLTIPLFFIAVFRIMEDNEQSDKSGENGGNGENNTNGLENIATISSVLEEPLLPSRAALVYGGGLLSPPQPFAKTPTLNYTGIATEDISSFTTPPPPQPSSWYRTSAIRVLTVACTIIVSILLGPLFSEVISLVGAFSMSLIAFILPSAFYLKIFGKKLTVTNRIAGWILFVFGIFALCSATWQSIDSMVYFFGHANHERMCGSTLTNKTAKWF
jgi:amino acid permease